MGTEDKGQASKENYDLFSGKPEPLEGASPSKAVSLCPNFPTLLSLIKIPPPLRLTLLPTVLLQSPGLPWPLGVKQQPLGHLDLFLINKWMNLELF